MNLTRRILEGIHEVELKINPEFQKKRGVNFASIVNALTANGWKLDSVTQQKGAYFYKHPELPGAEIDFAVDVSTDMVRPIMNVWKHRRYSL